MNERLSYMGKPSFGGQKGKLMGLNYKAIDK